MIIKKQANYKIEIRDIESVTAVVMCYKGPVKEAAKHFSFVFKAIRGQSNGAPFLCFYSVDIKSNIGEMELCVPTAEVVNANGISIKKFSVLKAACLTHMGPYEDLPASYEAIHEYIHEHGLSILPPWREIYIKGPGMLFKGNSKKYITEIVFPLKEV
jgi:effector-binding domain-containing protein